MIRSSNSLADAVFDHSTDRLGMSRKAMDDTAAGTLGMSVEAVAAEATDMCGTLLGIRRVRHTVLVRLADRLSTKTL